MNRDLNERALRRPAASLGLCLRKSRSRTPSSPAWGGYMLTDASLNAVVAGGSPWAYSLTLNDVAAFLAVDQA